MLALLVVAGAVYFLLRQAEPILRARVVQALQAHFHARVELDAFHVSFVDGVRAEGKGLRIWPPAQVEGVSVPSPAGPVAPLIRVDEFRFNAPLRYEPGKPVHIQVVELKGLHIHLPPRSHFEKNPPSANGAGASKPWGTPGMMRFQVDTLECADAELVLGTSNPAKLPMEVAIAHLKLTHIGADKAMGFDAQLTNPRPVGAIHSTGSFGPWHVEDPGESPVNGDYRFDHADLGDFKGIAGILNSTGHYQGTLRNLTTDGETDTPDFRLTQFGNPMPLHTRFHAKVDGTNGDTWLEPVEATLGHSHFFAQGQIVRVVVRENGAPPRSVGHDIALNINIDKARLEDFLRLASRSATQLLTGPVAVKAALHIPPGKVPVHRRMTLNGRFVLDQARFTSAKIQDRIEELSLRGQGRPKEVKTLDSTGTRSRMTGDFQMANGVIKLSTLDYTVPGADIQLRGSYGLEGGALDFRGTAKMQATVSQMVGGWKGLLLKPADRFFKKNGAGTEIPIHIKGTRENPKFGFGLDN